MSEAVLKAAHNRKQEIIASTSAPLSWLLEGWPSLLFVSETWVSIFLGFAVGVFVGGAVL